MNSFSIIIPVKSDCHAVAYEHLRSTLPEDLPCEVLIAEGSAPSRQRNQAAKEASGDILYFLDDDSLISPGNIMRCIDGMRDPSVAVVGGPSITPSYDTPLQQLFGYALSSVYGAGAVCNRYRSTGNVRTTTDKELILCNLAVRRSVFSDLGGFNECLYPNEENEFLERVVSAGHVLLHDPQMSVLRSQRKTIRAFIRQMFSYGRGRAQQALITSSYPVTSFIPLFFVGYLLLSLIVMKNVFLFAPLMLYLVAALTSTLLVCSRTRRLYALCMIGIYPLMHIANGAGLLWGLVNGKPDPVRDSAITVKRVIGFGPVCE